MAEPQLNILGQDLIALGLVTKTPDTIERKTFQRDKLISNNFKFQCRNEDDFFSTGNSKSMFNNIDWLYTPVTYVNEDSITTWSGILVNIKNNHRNKTTVLDTRDNLFRFRTDYISYTSSVFEDAATIAKAIMVQEGFTFFDDKTIQDSINHLINQGVLIKATFNLSDNMTMFAAIEKLALVCGADAYSSNGNIFFKVWRVFAGGVSISINDSVDTRLKSNPIVTYLENQLINDYSIDYEGSSGTPLTDANGGDIGSISRTKFGTRSLQPLQTGVGKQIVFKDTITAQFVGEQMIKRSHANLSTIPAPIIKIQFDLDIKFKEFITLQTFFKLTLADENWVDKIFEVYEFRRGEDRQNINVVGYEVVT